MPSASPAGALPFFPDPQHGAHSPGPVPPFPLPPKPSAWPRPIVRLCCSARVWQMGRGFRRPLDMIWWDSKQRSTSCVEPSERANKRVSESRLQWLLFLLRLYLMTFKVRSTAGLRDHRSVRAAEGSVRGVKGVMWKDFLSKKQRKLRIRMF